MLAITCQPKLDSKPYPCPVKNYLSYLEWEDVLKKKSQLSRTKMLYRPMRVFLAIAELSSSSSSSSIFEAVDVLVEIDKDGEPPSLEHGDSRFVTIRISFTELSINIGG